MPIVTSHCLPGGSDCHGHSPRFPWPDDCTVQWGDDGIVLVQGGEPYHTAFFEAFPRDPDTFVRGEGKDVAEAERQAWDRYRRIADCPGHEIERAGYRSGAGRCARCDMFVSRAFEPLERCVRCGRATYHCKDVNGGWWCDLCVDQMPPELVPPELASLRRSRETLSRMSARDLRRGLEAVCKALTGKPPGDDPAT